MSSRTPGELEPKRLLDEGATPAALREALHALRGRAPSDASAARIRARIQSPPPRPRGASSILASLALLALLGLGASRLWTAPGTVGSSESQPRTAPVPEVATPAVEPAPARPGPGPVEPPQPVTTPQAPTREPALVPPRSASVPTAEQPDPPRRMNARPSRPQRASEPEPERAPVLAAAVPTRAQDPAAPSPQEIAAPEAVVERSFADPQDEAGLLYRAKRLSSSDPNAALRLLVLHEASFPDGAFAQERDMLEIQIHERLGRTSVAKRLAAQFEQRYPGSVYSVSP